MLIMKKTIMGMVFGILAAGLLAGCQKKAVEFSKFEYGSGGAPWELVYRLIIDFEKGVLVTKEAKGWDSFRSNPKTETISLTPEQIAELQKALNSADVTGWKDKYENRRGVCDGTSWNASYVLKDGTGREIAGNNSWPRGFKALPETLEKMGVQIK